MERDEIKKISEKNFSLNDIEEIKKNYLISYGKYESHELKKCIRDKKPFFLKNNFIIGYEDNKFITDKNDKISIDRMVKAVIIEDVIEQNEIEEVKEPDYFAIIGKNVWEEPISEFKSIIGSLKVGELYLPPHSAVFNFLKPTEKEIKGKVVSVLEGVNINIYSKDNYIGNAFHEMGHLFYRDMLTYDEKQYFDKHQEYLPPAAIYEYKWERSDGEEVFCTLYKWFLKSILVNPSFYNILEHEDPKGLGLLKKVFDRIRKDKIISDVWELEKDDVFKYINPKGKVIAKKGTFERIKDIELPDNLLNDIDSYRDGIMYINLNKAKVPVKDNRIDWEEMKIHKEK